MTSFVVPALVFSLLAFLVPGLRSDGDGESQNDNFRLLIMHNNDLHAHFEEMDVYASSCSEENIKANQCYGGFARMKQAINDGMAEAKAKNISSIFLNAGDAFQGTAYYTLYKSDVVTPMMDSLGADVMTLGNHEFDDGIQNLLNYVKRVKTPIVVCNLNFTSEPRLKLPNVTPSKVLEVNGQKIGIIGYLTPDTMAIAKTEKLEIFDEIPSIREEAKRLKKQGVKIIIGLGHSGFQRDIQIAKEVPELSLIVGGHSHTLLHTPTDEQPSVETVDGSYPHIVEHASGKRIPIVQAYAYCKYLGKLWVTFDKNGNVVKAEGNPLLLNSTVGKDPKVQNLVESWAALVRERLGVVKGYTRTFIDKPDFKKGEFESTGTNLITDALRDMAIRANNNTSLPIAVFQTGGVRSRIDNKKNGGAVTIGDLLTLLPFETPMYQVQYRGSTIKAALEQSISVQYHYYYPYFLVFSGLRVRYDMSKPIGERVEFAEVLCSECSEPKYYPLQREQIYTFVISDFLMQGGDKFEILQKEIVNSTTLDFTDTQAVISYFENHKIVYPVVEDRIVVKGTTQVSSASALTIPIYMFLLLPSIITSYYAAL